MPTVQTYPRRCPKCRSKKCVVLHTRDYPKYLYRQRECEKCKARWRTYELAWSGHGVGLVDHLNTVGSFLGDLKKLMKGYKV
jgi:transcriptional regulator NrdR family protein